MTIASFNFLLFSSIAAVLYQFAARLPGRMPRDAVLLIVNLYFLSTFAAGGAIGFLPLAGFVVLGYGCVAILRGGPKAALTWICIAITLGYFFWLKKYTFVPGDLLLRSPYASIGVSYIFFRIMQLLIDAGSGNIEERPGVIVYLNYLLNFTTLVSGPIQRYEDFAAARTAPEPLTWFAGGNAIERISFGAFKVLVLAAVLSDWHNDSLAALPGAGAPWMRAESFVQIVVSYTLYLYCNFSGYTDIVIGVARFFGNVLPENFNRPFSALNFMDFWARWHMTLSNWLKTYVYNPLMKALMGRITSPGADPYIGAFSFMVTFFLIGLWHGQTWVFVLYGVLLGVGISGNKLYQVFMIDRLGRKKYRALAGNWLYQMIARGLTFTYFSFSLVCFWANWAQITAMWGRLGWGGVCLAALIVFATATALLELWERMRGLAFAVAVADAPLVLSRYLRTVWVTAAVLITVAVTSLTATPAPDIVYKNF